MGCVLGTGATTTTGCVLNRTGVVSRRRRREVEEPSVSAVASVRLDGTNAVRVPKEREGIDHASDISAPERPRPKPEAFNRNQQEWPTWLLEAAGDAIQGWTPRRASTFEKLDKIGQGTYSNVYKAKDLVTGKIVALKKVRFDNLEPEGVRFMAREILVLRQLDHPHVIKLEGLVTSRISCSIYLVFEYMEHDLAGLVAFQSVKFTEPQVKCYMKQLLLGLEHCHNQGVLHRDIKGSNLLIDNDGILKIADFGLSTFYDTGRTQPLTNQVVTLWYRPPELLLGATSYGIGVDLWSAGCILAELLAGKPIMPGQTEVEQLHKIFKLCGSPSEEYWMKFNLPKATLFKPQQPYKRCIAETFKDFPSSSLPLIDSLLSLDPDERSSASSALTSEFLTTKPFACEPSSLPRYPPSKELDLKLRDEARRQRGLSGKASAVAGPKRARVRDCGGRGIPAPKINAEIQGNIDRRRVVTQANAKSNSEKFPPPHHDGAVGFPLNTSHKGPVSFSAASAASSSTASNPPTSRSLESYTAAGGPSGRRKTGKGDPWMACSQKLFHALRPASIGLSMDLRSKCKGSVSEVFGSAKLGKK